MTRVGREILDQALHLSPEDRLWVAQALWDSVDPAELARFYMDDELMAEIRRRDAEMDAGHSISHEEMMASLQEGRNERRTT